MTGARFAAGAALALASATSSAHGPVANDAGSIWWQWDFGPAVTIPLVLAGWAYLRGLRGLWGRAGVGRGISRRQACYYLLGMLVLVIALVSPLDALSSASFGLHMVQHLLLILVAPPLLVAGAADVAFLWALPASRRAGFGGFESRVGRWLGAGSGQARNRLVVVALATATLWLWHVPALYDMAVRHEPLHIAEHAGFIITALLFWAGVLRLRPGDHADNGMRILSIAAMALQGSLLGALITFATRPLYESHMEPSFLGLDPLVDQQIAGLLMWVPPAFLYIGVLAYLFVQWLEAVGRRNRPPRSHSRASPG